MRQYFLLLLLLSPCMAFSQHISGSVYERHSYDTVPLPLEFVIVSLHSEDDSTLSSVTTNASGFYRFNDVKPGSYFIKTSFSDFEDYSSELIKIDSLPVDYQNIYLKRVALKTIAIEKKKSIVKQEAGKTVVDVGAMTSTTGLMAIDLLRKMPGVRVDNDGNITLKGKANVTILFDGRAMNMSGKQIASILQAMQASEIENIEIITSPSAKYDAQGDGGMININFKKAAKKGFYGDVQVTYGQGILPKSNSGINVAFNSGKWKLNASYSINANKNGTYGYTNRNFGALSSGLTYNQGYTYKVPNINHSYSFGGDYKVNKNLSIGFSHYGLFMNDWWEGTVDGLVKDSLGQLQQRFTTFSHVPWYGTSLHNNVDFKYKIDSTGTISGKINYMHYNEGSVQDINIFRVVSNITDYAHVGSIQSGNNNNFAAQLDFERLYLKKLRFESGAKWMYNAIDNNIDFSVEQTVDVVPSTPSKKEFTFREQVSAAYVQAKWSEKKWQYQAGVRSEFWHARGEELLSKTVFTRDYLQFFPSAYLSYNPSEKHSFSFSYNRRIQRPSSHMLTPVSYFDDPYFLYTGNPKLLPQLSHNIELSHSFKGGRFITTLNYMHSDNYIQQWAVSQRDSSNIMDISTINIPLYENFGASLSYYQQVKKWWAVQFFANVYQNHLAGYLSNTRTTVDNYYTTATFNSTHVFTLPKAWTIELSGNYTMKQLVGYTINNPLGALGISVKKDIAAGRGSLKLNCQDVFYTFKYSGTARYNGLESRYLYSWDNRVVYLSFNWKLGSKWFINKEEDKKAAERGESGIK
ncbi:MAG: TonB-dependent receptor domain-containing protein [Flavobacteriales bacterium]